MLLPKFETQNAVYSPELLSPQTRQATNGFELPDSESAVAKLLLVDELFVLLPFVVLIGLLLFVFRFAVCG